MRAARDIVRPPLNSGFFVPQQAYLPPGTLREAYEPSLPGLAVRAQLDVERPGAALLVCHVPDLFGDRSGLDEEIVRLVLVALARPGDVDHRIDYQVGDVHALGSQVARHG